MVRVAGSPYDFTSAGGAPLGSRYFDDSFLALDKSSEGQTEIGIFDPAARYGIRLTAFSPHVEPLQLYSPPDAPFVVVEPQLNLSDPFSGVWPRGFNAGMVTVAPGQSVTWAVRWLIYAT